MKNIFFSSFLGLILITSSCGPAAEDREAMHRRAKVFQDSIANVIRISMDEAAAPAPEGPAMVAPASPTTIASGQPAAAMPTPATKNK